MMDSGDGEVDANLEAPTQSEPVSSPPYFSATTEFSASEALMDSSSRDPQVFSACAENSADLSAASEDCSSSAQSSSYDTHSLKDPLQGSPYFPSSQVMPAQQVGSSLELFPRQLEDLSHEHSSSHEASHLQLRDGATLEQPWQDPCTQSGIHECSSDEASPLQLQDGATPEQPWQDPCIQSGIYECSSVLEGDSLVEEALPLPSNSETSLSHTSTLEQRPPEACSQEDSSRMEEEESELSDDIKREMLREICKGVSILSCKSEAPGGDCSVYLIGTAHVSEASCREVQAAVHLIKPQVVFLELCQKRTAVLQRTSFVVPTVSDMITMWKQRKTNMLGIVYSWFLAKVAAKLDIRPGSEFRAAYEEALACGAKVVLGDRDIEVTLRRTWGKMSAWHKTKLIFLMLYQSLFLPKADQLNELIEKLKDADILTIAFEELGKFSPALMETLINERDLFMTAALQKIAEHHSSIVAVVGRGHVAGITKYWGEDIPIHTLLEIPGRRSVLGLRLRTYAVIASVALASIAVFSLR